MAVCSTIILLSLMDYSCVFIDSLLLHSSSSTFHPCEIVRGDLEPKVPRCFPVNASRQSFLDKAFLGQPQTSIFWWDPSLFTCLTSSSTSCPTYYLFHSSTIAHNIARCSYLFSDFYLVRPSRAIFSLI